MMARVGVGHTGRDLRFPPKVLKPAFILMLTAVCVRVFLPLILPSAYQWSLIGSGVLWVGAFLLFVLGYFKILISPRVTLK
jgi:uncharacterized protein involved in response to NO